jgi:transposase
MMAIAKRGDRANNRDLVRETEQAKDKAENAEKRAFEAESENTRLKVENAAHARLINMLTAKLNPGALSSMDPDFCIA